MLALPDAIVRGTLSPLPAEAGPTNYKFLGKKNKKKRPPRQVQWVVNLVVGWASLRLDGDGGGSAALVSLSGHNLVVVAAELETGLSPSVEVGLNIDGSANTMVGADGPELVEGSGSLDGWLLDTGGLVDVVGAAVGLDGAELVSAGGWVVGAEAVDDVVFDQGVLGPAVDGEVAVPLGLPGAAVGNGPRRKR